MELEPRRLDVEKISSQAGPRWLEYLPARSEKTPKDSGYSQGGGGIILTIQEGYGRGGTVAEPGKTLVTLATEAPVKKPETPTKSKATPEPTYKVILHNDSSTPMEHVVQSLQQVIPKMTQEKAISIMLEAHTKGKAVAKRCHKELAEMYEEGLRSRGLTATIEPD